MIRNFQKEIWNCV